MIPLEVLAYNNNLVEESEDTEAYDFDESVIPFLDPVQPLLEELITRRAKRLVLARSSGVTLERQMQLVNSSCSFLDIAPVVAISYPSSSLILHGSIPVSSL